MKYENGLGIEWQWISWKYWLIFAKNLAEKSMSFSASFKTFLYPKSLAQVCLSLACSGREKFPISRRDTNNKCRKLTSHWTESAKKAWHLCCVYHPTFGPAEGASNSNVCAGSWPGQWAKKSGQNETVSQRTLNAADEQKQNWKPGTRGPESQVQSAKSRLSIVEFWVPRRRRYGNQANRTGGAGQEGEWGCPRSRTSTFASCRSDAIRLRFRFGFGFRRAALAATRVLKFPLARTRISCRRLVGSFAYKSISAPVIGRRNINLLTTLTIN